MIARLVHDRIHFFLEEEIELLHEGGIVATHCGVAVEKYEERYRLVYTCARACEPRSTSRRQGYLCPLFVVRASFLGEGRWVRVKSYFFFSARERERDHSGHVM